MHNLMRAIQACKVLPVLGTPHTLLPLYFVRELEGFEGLILSELASEEDPHTYLEKWCTQFDGVVRWLVVKVTQCDIARYLQGETSMLDLLGRTSAGEGYLWDRRGSATVAFNAVLLADLPPKYLPKPSVHHDPALAPDDGDHP